MQIVQILRLFVICTSLVGCSLSKRPTCSARPVVEGQPGSVTCQFPVNVANQKQYINILRYDFNGLHFVPELVLKCFWRLNSATPDCSVAAGFDFDGQVNTTVTVTMPTAAKERHAGMYACDYAGAAPSEFYGCSLHVKSSRINCSAPSAPLGQPTNVTCNFNSNVKETKNNFYISHVPRDLRSKPVAEDVLTCNWMTTKDKHFCYVNNKEGYNCNIDNTSDRVTVHIPTLQEHHIGSYYCNTVPPEKGVTAEQCHLSVVEETRTSSTTKPTTSGPASAASSKEQNASAFMTLLLWLLMYYTTAG